MQNIVKDLSNEDLMKLYSSILSELNERNVIRTQNSPQGDYAEWLFANQYSLNLESSSTKGYDVKDEVNNIRYQIKSRRIKSSSRAVQLGVIRNYDSVEFDFLIAMIFTEDFTLSKVYKIPHAVISEYGRYSEHQNGYVLILTSKLKSDVRVGNLTGEFVK